MEVAVVPGTVEVGLGIVVVEADLGIVVVGVVVVLLEIAAVEVGSGPLAVEGKGNLLEIALERRHSDFVHIALQILA